jgi:hypothetical protein
MCQKCRTQNARLGANESEVRRLARQIAARQQSGKDFSHLVQPFEDAKKHREIARTEPAVVCEDIENGITDTCSYPGCDRDRRYKGLCRLHYNRQFEGRDMETGKSHARR